MRSSSIRRSLAAGASIAVATAGLAFAPAVHAESGVISFDCKLLSGSTSSVFTTVADTNLPAKVTQGSSTPVGFTATITVPESTANLARLLGKDVKGTADIATTINDVAAPAKATLPTTSTGASGPLVLKVAGAGVASYVADTVGAKTVKVAGYNADLVFTAADGKETPVDVKCLPAAGAVTTVDTFEVVAPGTPTDPPVVVQETSTETAVKHKKWAGKVVAKVQVENADGTAASGDVKVVLKKGKKKVGKAVVTLNAKGKGKAKFLKVSKPGKYTVKANYGGSDVSKKSSAKTTFTTKRK